MAGLARLVTTTMWSIPAPTASSMISCSAGVSMIGSSSLGTALVAGRNRVPMPAAGMTAVRTWIPALQGRRALPLALALVQYDCQSPPQEPTMPTYVYKFIDTGETIEVQQAFTDDSLTEANHPTTGETMAVKKVFTPVGVTFRGGGFYKTDSRGGSSKSSSTASTSSNGDGASSGSGDKASSEKSPTSSSDSSSASTTSKPAEKTAAKTGAKAD